MENENFSPVVEKKRKHGLKPFTFLSGLIDLAIVVAVVYCLLMFATKFFGEWMNENGANAIVGIIFLPLVIALLFLCGVGAIIFLITGIMSLVMSFKSDKKFRSLTGLIITSIVFDVLIEIISLFLALSMTGEAQTVFIILLIAIGIGIIFKILDLILFKHREKKYKVEVATTSQENQTSSSGIDFSVLGKKDNEEN